MDLLLNDEQQMMVDAIDDVLRCEFPLERLQQGAATLNEASWRHLAQLGWFGLGLSEAEGGVGCGLAEEMLLCRASQKHLLSPSLLATMLGARMACCDGDSDLAAAMVAGETRVSLAVSRQAMPLDTELLSGNVYLIDASQADYLLLWDHRQAVLVPASGLQREVVDALDNSLPLELASLDGLAPRLCVAADREDIALRATVLLAAMETGLAEASCEMAVDYAKIREQFGAPIGSFQAIKHFCADMACRVEAANCQTRMATVVVAERHQDASLQAAAARLLAGVAARENAARNIQVHGAMGYAAECNAHFFLKRARLLESIGGTARQYQRDMLGLRQPEQMT